MAVIKGTAEEILKAIKGKKIKVISYTIDALTDMHTLEYEEVKEKPKKKSK